MAEGAAGRGGDVRQLNVRVPAPLLAEAKKRAIDLDVTLAEAVAEAIAEWLDRHPADGGG
ncbi:MAG TPA: hypothetical protein VF228_02240 [Iamia sp.]